jgi:hypothetical protein
MYIYMCTLHTYMDMYTYIDTYTGAYSYTHGNTHIHAYMIMYNTYKYVL